LASETADSLLPALAPLPQQEQPEGEQAVNKSEIERARKAFQLYEKRGEGPIRPSILKWLHESRNPSVRLFRTLTEWEYEQGYWAGSEEAVIACIAVMGEPAKQFEWVQSALKAWKRQAPFNPHSRALLRRADRAANFVGGGAPKQTPEWRKKEQARKANTEVKQTTRALTYCNRAFAIFQQEVANLTKQGRIQVDVETLRELAVQVAEKEFHHFSFSPAKREGRRLFEGEVARFLEEISSSSSS
jgi:hypothetical protein